ncbi:MAG: amidase [Candidatus Comchoanobacterales bacterium]
MMEDVFTQSAKKIAQSIAKKDISSTELVSACIQRIEYINPKINAVVQFRPEQALQEAQEKDAMLTKGQVMGPLHGIPFTLKDVYNTQGDCVTAGCLGLKNNVATEDATIVKRLKQAGAILLGKSNTPELECAADTDNLVYGLTSNPYHVDYSCGGSSGGSAAVVSACGSVFDVGADAGGSLRIPAHYCGITTIRPTMGRIPTSGTVYGLRTGIGARFCAEGPLSRYVEDLPLLLSILQGPDGIDPNIVDSPLKTHHDVSLSKLNIAYFNNNTIIGTTEETKMAIQSACDVLTEYGCHVCNDKPYNLEKGCTLFQEVLGAHASQGFKDALKQMNVKNTSSLLEKIIVHLESFACSLPEFMNRLDRWDVYRSKVLQFFNKYDVLISPVTPGAALHHNTPMWNPEMIKHASYSWSITGTLLPVVVVRAGYTKEGLPIGIQIITRHFEEHIGIAVALQIEKHLGGWRMPNL